MMMRQAAEAPEVAEAEVEPLEKTGWQEAQRWLLMRVHLKFRPGRGR